MTSSTDNRPRSQGSSPGNRDLWIWPRSSRLHFQTLPAGPFPSPLPDASAPRHPLASHPTVVQFSLRDTPRLILKQACEQMALFRDEAERLKKEKKSHRWCTEELGLGPGKAHSHNHTQLAIQAPPPTPTLVNSTFILPGPVEMPHCTPVSTSFPHPGHVQSLVCILQQPWPSVPTCWLAYLFPFRDPGYVVNSPFSPGCLSTKYPDVLQFWSSLRSLLSVPARPWQSSLTKMASFSCYSSSEVWLWSSFVTSPSSQLCNLLLTRRHLIPRKKTPSG